MAAIALPTDDVCGATQAGYYRYIVGPARVKGTKIGGNCRAQETSFEPPPRLARLELPPAASPNHAENAALEPRTGLAGPDHATIQTYRWYTACRTNFRLASRWFTPLAFSSSSTSQRSSPFSATYRIASASW
jgi:hypothetical protein